MQSAPFRKPVRPTCRNIMESWRVLSSVRLKSTDVSEEHVASIFRIEEYAEQETSIKAGSCFDPEDGGDLFLSNVGWLSTGYTALYPRK
jgi:hypothetical protein